MSQKLSEKEAPTIDAPPEEPLVYTRPEPLSHTVTRADLADAVHQRIGLSRTESAEFVEMVLSEIFQAIVAGDDVKLSSFGSFHIRWKNERVGRNPKTGAAAPISARRVVMFKASNVLRARINGHRPIGGKS
ncbi:MULTISPECIES: integration host factor subunit alpha [Methylosinus]|uniref:Integration host factor subunit alpha n=1 Tax=Methylosinus trichosporium (strain ATCC 35070 / NCIMB 11131 / UNIQEM 75 / OB3b) TaxID=595536 RepID=A0A2D2CWC8_METT3|nr:MULTISPECIES: integration host factor subunit alpha [Methylosinus]ATQ67098.1 integration host factor subunit alpha [Methylosinus trichosporium OB3b]